MPQLRTLAPGQTASRCEHALRRHSVVRVQQSSDHPNASASHDRPATLGQLKASGHVYRTVKQEIRENLLDADARRAGPVPRHRRLRRDGAAARGARADRRARHHPAGRARPGEDTADPHAGRPARRVDPGGHRLRDQRPSLRAGLRPLPAAGGRAGRRARRRAGGTRASATARSSPPPTPASAT